MYDTAKRVELVKKRVRENTRRKQRRGVCGLSAVCVFLLAALTRTAGLVIGQGQTAAQGGFGTMLLREDAGGLAAFAVSAALTAVCMRLHERDKRKEETKEDNGANSTRSSTISGGTFYGSVINGKRSEISGGTFHGTVTNEADSWPGGHIGTISGGSFDEKPYGAFTVTFDVRGGTPEPEPQVRVNAPATAPTTDPTKDDQQFLGWYTDSECTQPYEFTNTFKEWILADTTLYALWSDDRCAMTFDSNGGSEVQPQLLLISGDKAKEPLDPTKEGATFLGWFTQSGKHWNFTPDPVTENITLKAMWLDGAAPTPPTTVAVTGVTLDQTALTLAKGGSQPLTATVAQADATDKTVSWSSTDASVASVSSDGRSRRARRAWRLSSPAQRTAITLRPAPSRCRRMRRSRPTPPSPTFGSPAHIPTTAPCRRPP